MIATEQQMKDARIDVAWGDYCAHLLIPLNKCRHQTMYLPWKCQHERHEYEKCQYGEYVPFLSFIKLSNLVNRATN